MTSKLTETVHAELGRILDGPADRDKLMSALRNLSKWRSMVIGNTLRQKSGVTVQQGPFAGMTYDLPATEGAYSARLLGCYEALVAPVIEEIIASAPDLIVDIGCAEGDYAVGLSRRLPYTRIMASDLNEKAQDSCRLLAERNRVADQIGIGDAMTSDDFAMCAN